MFSTPFFSFFDTVNNEVEKVNRLLGYPENTDYLTTRDNRVPKHQLITAGNGDRAGKIQKRPHRNHGSSGALSTRLNRWFDDDWSLSDFDLGPSNIIPPVDLFDHEQNYDARITIPGIDSGKNINIEYHKDGNEIVVSGEIPSTVTEHNKDNLKVKEVSSGQFKRVISLPENPGVNADKIKASYKNGILNLHIPKLKAAKKDNVRKIGISDE